MRLGRWVRGGTWILKASKVRAVEDWKTLGRKRTTTERQRLSRHVTSLYGIGKPFTNLIHLPRRFPLGSFLDVPAPDNSAATAYRTACAIRAVLNMP
jgi:hypothetical protein